ncbi:isocitrate dehydrogenase (NAD+) [Eubacterium pyruvativorans]|uniref:Isocitrate dehydrogenase (NAD+) n=1 Tax=Eubacterium pyruvativorans TaxID=155865 RepID=A0A1I7G9F5_9FIRM|nr:isocitrate/isopropylmalate family dehydrogenase [Eubacterium pyruvativorans]MDY4049483.1 isocitrate/isopropylmalate family dehydrogenase [Eubacterium pyruvativorans]SFO07871.1 isocitrate dehydrogenase (NAD+) [Eubacterium pyruvativorans]SFU45074.1 isocitrate dehydrogenase (NAD+) [Eubacterium pyruvativorans]
MADGKKGVVQEIIDMGVKEMNAMAEVSDITGQFRNLLMEQMERVEKMEESAGKKKDFKSLPVITIGICPGDGIGPSISEQAVRVLESVLSEEIAAGKIRLKQIDGLTIERRLAEMKAVPDDVMEEIRECDVLLKGPTTTPKGGSLESANVALRRALDLYANVRPVSVPEEGIDWIFFRENTEGEYAVGSRGIEIPGKLSIDFKVITEPGTRRIAKAAYDYAVANGKTNIEVVTKANIMKKTDGNFSRICHEVASEYPGLVLEDWYIDIMTAKLLDKTRRSDFQVFVLPNLYGDIITDEAAEIQGGVGTAGSANIGDQYAMFEAIHGSAVRMIEDGRGAYANPASLIKAAAMMLNHIGFPEKAKAIENALDICVEKEKAVVITGHEDGATGAEFTDYLLSKLG